MVGADLDMSEVVDWKRGIVGEYTRGEMRRPFARGEFWNMILRVRCKPLPSTRPPLIMSIVFSLCALIHDAG